MHVPQNVKFTLPFYFYPQVCFIGPKFLSRIASLNEFSKNENFLFPMQVVTVCYDISGSTEQFLALTATAL